MKLLWAGCFLFLSLTAPLAAQKSPSDLCNDLQRAWNNTQRYECVYTAQTYYEGKISTSRMRYSYQKPSCVRMDIESPRRGAVLIYNPQIAPDVRVKPFAGFKRLILKFKLNNPRVMSDSGGTIDKSDLGHRMEKFCSLLQQNKETAVIQDQTVTIDLIEDGKKIQKKFTFDAQNFLIRIEVFDHQGNMLESFRWDTLKINPDFHENLFVDF